MNELNHRDMEERNDVDLMLFRILEGGASVEDLRFFKAWMQEEKNRQYFHQVKEVWNAVAGAALTEEEKEQAYRRFCQHISVSASRRRMRVWRYARYAALVVVALGIWWLAREKRGVEEVVAEIATQTHPVKTVSGITLTRADGTVVCLTGNDALEQEADGTQLVRSGERHLEYLHSDTAMQAAMEEIYNAVDVPRGERFHLTLADGTRVWLNSESRLVYPVRFVGKERVVELEGQAYFEVSKDAAHPFIVRGGEVETRVLGTAFDMSLYPDEGDRVVLVEGMVRVAAYGHEAVLHPDQQAVADAAGQQIAVETVDARALTMWKDGILLLDNQNFEEMLGKLSRWYGITFVNRATVSSDDRFNGKFHREDVGEAMHIISLSAKVNYTIKQDTIYIQNN